MMSVFEKRVEAAMYGYNTFDSGWEKLGALERQRARIRNALVAADAVVTEEQIAETILKALVFTNENSKPWADGLARDIAAMFRGGGNK